MQNLFNSAVLGLIQGLTEFLPISSSSHFFLIQRLLGVSGPSIFYTLILHLAALMATLIVFRKEVLRILKAFLRIPLFCKNVFRKGHLAIADDTEAWTCILIFMATIVTGTLGFLLEKKISESLQWWWIQPLGLIVTGLALYSTKNLMLDQSKAKQKAEGKAIPQVTIKDSILIGLAQASALVPGISRSGATICTALWLRVNRKFAGEFSFLISIPAMIGLLLFKCIRGVPIEREMLPSYLVGFVISLVLGIISLIYLLKWIRKGKLHYFAFYCWALGIVTFLLGFRS